MPIPDRHHYAIFPEQVLPGSLSRSSELSAYPYQNHPYNDRSDSCCLPNPIGDGHIYMTIRYLHAGSQSIRDARIHFP